MANRRRWDERVDVRGRQDQTERWEALLRAARRCAAQASSEAVLRTLLEEAVQLVGGDDGGVARWDAGARQLVQVQSFLPSENQGAVLDLERSASGRAAATRAAVVVNDDQRRGDPQSPAGRLGTRAGVAVPLVHEGRLIGTLSVSTFQPDKQFAPEDAAALELLASIGASALIGRERADLEGALAIRNDLLAEVSHDLRTPLTAARGQVQLLQRDAARIGPPHEERLIRGLERVDRAIGRMTQLIDLLRDAALLEAGQPLDLRRRPLDLIELARAEVLEYRELAPDHRLRLVAPEEEVVGVWDALRLERVLDNLLGNAVKYSPDGGSVTVTVRRQGAWATIAVRDRGVGIPAADQGHVFDRFFRAANVGGRIRGTGIGLAGAKQIVEQHGGSIAVRSREGHGSTFTIRLPLNPDPPPTSPLPLGEG
jgi:signal transduction histidine kinase